MPPRPVHLGWLFAPAVIVTRWQTPQGIIGVEVNAAAMPQIFGGANREFTNPECTLMPRVGMGKGIGKGLPGLPGNFVLAIIGEVDFAAAVPPPPPAAGAIAGPMVIPAGPVGAGPAGGLARTIEIEMTDLGSTGSLH